MVTPLQEIFRLIRELDSLNTGNRAAVRLVGYGPLAVAPLRAYLLDGRPRKIFQPRLWAVEALSRLGAKDVLLEYLFQVKEIPDPEDRFGEEAVESSAARFLSSWSSEDIYQALLKLSQRRMLAGLIEALAEFKRPEAIPYFERALEDDFYRPIAEKAFQKLGKASCSALAASAVTPSPSLSMETPSSLQRRRSAVKLLDAIGMPPGYWAILRDLINEPDEEIMVRVSKIGVGTASKQDRMTIGSRLLELVSSAAWYLLEDVEETLVALEEEVAAVIEGEISMRMKPSEQERARDARLRALLRVWHRLDRKRNSDARKVEKQ